MRATQTTLNVPLTDYTVYIDDSGHPQSGLALYSALAVPRGSAERRLAQWRQFRMELDAEYGIPEGFELHANEFIAGRRRPGGNNPSKADRWLISQRGLQIIGDWSDARVCTVYSADPSRPAQSRHAAFRGLLHHLNGWLAEEGCAAALVVDGDGTDPSYAALVEQVAPERIIGIPSFRPAHECPWLQMADLIAYTAFQRLARQQSREFMWGWYTRYLPKAHAPVSA